MSINSEIRILIVDDEEISRNNIGHVLEKDGYATDTAADGRKALAKMRRRRYDLIITDLKMNSGIDGMQVMEAARKLFSDVEVIIITGYASVNSAVDAMAKGAFYYLAKPVKLRELRAMVEKALERTALRREIAALRAKIGHTKGLEKLVGRSESAQKLRDDIALAARLDCNVLITGEPGTGRELAARTLWELSSRANQCFIPISCGAFTEKLMLNELFGHEKDALPGQMDRRAGLLESASGGTMFLDDIEEMPLMLQAKLLRVLQDKEIMEPGAPGQIPVDIRILSATSLNLAEKIRTGSFRQDLYYSLNVISIHIPPLRERKNDIPLLAYHFLKRDDSGRAEPEAITQQAMSRLIEYDFPGNIRELENIMEHSRAVCSGPEIDLQHLPENLLQDTGRSEPVEHGEKPPNLEEHEHNYIMSVLKSVRGNKTKAARIMGIDRVSLWRKLKRYQAKGYDVEHYLKK